MKFIELELPNTAQSGIFWDKSKTFVGGISGELWEISNFQFEISHSQKIFRSPVAVLKQISPYLLLAISSNLELKILKTANPAAKNSKNKETPELEIIFETKLEFYPVASATTENEIFLAGPKGVVFSLNFREAKNPVDIFRLPFKPFEICLISPEVLLAIGNSKEAVLLNLNTRKIKDVISNPNEVAFKHILNGKNEVVLIDERQNYFIVNKSKNLVETSGRITPKLIASPIYRKNNLVIPGNGKLTFLDTQTNKSTQIDFPSRLTSILNHIPDSNYLICLNQTGKLYFSKFPSAL